jgi:hypothetical protein
MANRKKKPATAPPAIPIPPPMIPSLSALARQPPSLSSAPSPPNVPLFMYEIPIPVGVQPGGKFLALIGSKRYLLTCPQVVQTFFVASPDPPGHFLDPTATSSPPTNMPSTVGICRGPAVRKPPVGQDFSRELSEIFRGPTAQQLLASQAAALLRLRPNSETATTTNSGQTENGIPQAVEFEDFFESSEDHSFQEYQPLYYHKGKPHPDQLVQSASLSGVNPPPIDYELSLPVQVCCSRSLHSPS